ncbi:cleavage polyadenylation factor subunit CLP1 NDAI_0E01090 [Naumovozyma dairenensis CBS 421]|uniref:Polynucleotide 5'-hydroxyl-kinase GRC3 n=1 Tax=Naumovozyma dairenensis (strain ATCC 10597 / BCRC 20456 / CBS 421 / NBRC 0211 / NRRL Y-12639) TaxID=1071378 RepID=G0WB05_NAUDC|nr:hypothetical protein NDAI_0E01090 [Naumovozyma dairenensis CBS 421]CCD24925.1 hypothetical protein NDAI_0E01090 [Naumovozyma dairenensis CBS 421]
MSILPGLTELTPELYLDVNKTHQLTLKESTEWKIDIPTSSKLTIKIRSGIAEIFGTELANDIEYVFTNWKISLLAVEDVILEWKCPDISGNKALIIQQNTTSKFVYNLHFALDKLRTASFNGPRIMIVGDTNSGKTALCRTLCSYAIKNMPYQPLFINLNPNEGIFTPPGCLSATPISDLLEVQAQTWGQSMTSGATVLHNKQPIVKNFGLEEVTKNKPLYLNCIDQLAKDVNERLQNDVIVQRSGCIINTPPLSQFYDNATNQYDSYDGLLKIIQCLNIGIVVILTNDTDEEQEKEKINKLFDKLKSIIDQNSIIRFPKLSGRFQDADDTYKRSLQRAAIREYFYGTPRTVLSPYAAGADFDEIVIWKSMELNVNMQQDMINPFQLESVPIEANVLQHALVAITYADRKASSEEVSKAPILGFGLITEVNEKRRKIWVLLPVPGRVPNKAIILTSYRYLE